MSKPVVNGLLEVDGTEVGTVQEFDLDRTQDWGELQDNEDPIFAYLIQDQKSWSATLTLSLRADEGTDDASTSFTSATASLETAYANANSVTVSLEYGGETDFGELEYSTEIIEADAKIASLSDSGSFSADGETWTREVELTGEEGFTVL